MTARELPDNSPQAPLASPGATRSFGAALLAGTCLVIAIVVGTVVFSIRQSHLLFTQEAALETGNTAALLERHIADVIEKADISLRTIAAETTRQLAAGRPDDKVLEEFITQQEALQPDIANLRVTDAAGVVCFGLDHPQKQGYSVAQRQFFMHARDNPDAGLIIDGPNLSRLMNTHVLVLARRLQRADGTFAGIVYANITSDHLRAMLAIPDLGAQGIAVLRTSDLRLIARHPPLPDQMEIGRANAPPTLIEHLKTDPMHGSYVVASPVDQVHRFIDYRQISGYPLYLVVGMASDVYLAAWRTQVPQYAGMGALAIALILLSAWLIHQSGKRQNQAMVAMQQQQAIARRAVSYNRSLIESSLDPLVTIGRDGKINDVNAATELITGRSQAELIGTEFSDYFVVPDLARAAYQQAFRDGAVRDLYLEIRHANGTRITPVLYNASVYRDEAGDIEGVFAAARDITRHRQAEQAKETINRALRLLTDCNELVIHAEAPRDLLDDICRVIVETGGYAMAWVGMAQSDAGKTVRPYAQCGTDIEYLNSLQISWADTERGRGPTGTAIRTGTTQVNQNCRVNPAMQPWRAAALAHGYLASVALPLKCSGNMFGALNIYSSETHAFGPDELALLEELASNVAYGVDTLQLRATQALAERELDQHRRHLEELVTRRTAELAAAKTMAERANNAKSRFLAAASHDLRQPLAALSIYVSTLGNKLSGADQDLLDNMKQCVTGLSEMLSDLLDLSKLEAGVVTPVIRDFPLDAVLRKVVSTYAPEARLKGLRLRSDQPELIGHSDPVLFHRILANLVANAVRYTTHGGILISCRRRQGRVWVEVWDTGIGIPADKTGEIFEEFKQLGNPERDRTKGSGMGLAIVAKTAALLNLQVQVRSRPGRGSVFAVELPLGSMVQPMLERDYAHRPRRVALVEDNPAMATALATALTQVGHTVTVGPSAADVLQGLGEDTPEILLSDYRLSGGQTGIDVIATFRARFGARLPALIITGDTDPAVIRRLADLQIDVQHKPLDLETLREKIAQLTGQAELDPDPAADATTAR